MTHRLECAPRKKQGGLRPRGNHESIWYFRSAPKPLHSFQSWMTLEGEHKFNMYQFSGGFQPLNHDKQKMQEMFPNNNHATSHLRCAPNTTCTLGCCRSPSKKFNFLLVERKYEENPKSQSLKTTQIAVQHSFVPACLWPHKADFSASREIRGDVSGRATAIAGLSAVKMHAAKATGPASPWPKRTMASSCSFGPGLFGNAR